MRCSLELEKNVYGVLVALDCVEMDANVALNFPMWTVIEEMENVYMGQANSFRTKTIVSLPLITIIERRLIYTHMELE